MGEKVSSVIFLLMVCVVMIGHASGCKRADKVATENMCRNYCKLKIGHLVEMAPPDVAQDGCTGRDQQVLTRAFKVVWLQEQHTANVWSGFSCHTSWSRQSRSTLACLRTRQGSFL
jgi:hypothetical protein